MELEGNVALVTGGASGLGEATARHLHGRGAHVVIFDRDEQRAKRVVHDLGARAEYVVGDARDEGDTQHAVNTAADTGPFRIVVACAGGGTQGGRTISRDGVPLDVESFVDTLTLNVVSTFNALRLSAAAMARLDPANPDGERGTIVMTSSISGLEGQVGTISYSTAKAAIIGMTIVAARDLSAAGIRVNTIAPGTMDTPIWAAADPKVKAGLETKVPFPRRFGQPGEFAALAAHLVTNRYINGQVIRLDGAIRFDIK